MEYLEYGMIFDGLMCITDRSNLALTLNDASYHSSARRYLTMGVCVDPLTFDSQGSVSFKAHDGRKTFFEEGLFLVHPAMGTTEITRRATPITIKRTSAADVLKGSVSLLDEMKQSTALCHYNVYTAGVRSNNTLLALPQVTYRLEVPFP